MNGGEKGKRNTQKKTTQIEKKKRKKSSLKDMNKFRSAGQVALQDWIWA